jgi:hypothetical protein
MAGTQTAPPWASVSAAVAVLTAERVGSRDELAAVVGDQVPGDVAVMLAAITNVILKALWPADEGAALLQQLGMVALERGEQSRGSG